MTKEIEPTDPYEKIEFLKKQVRQLKYAEKINETLFDISNAVNTTRDLDDLYASIHASLNRLIRVPNIFIAIPDQKKGLIHFPYYIDEFDDAKYIEKGIFKEKSLTGEVILSKKPLFLDEAGLKKREKENRIVGTVPRIWLGVPLIIDDVVIGVLAIQNYSDPDAYTKKDLDILISVSHQIAVAIERKRIHDALKINEERYRTLSEKSHDIIMRFDESCRHLYVNPAIEQIGLAPGDMIGRTHSQLDFPKDLIQEWEAAILKVFKTGKVNRVEFKLPSGTWIDWLLCPEFTGREDIKTVITFARDITERKQMEFNNICYDRINKKIINAKSIEQMLNDILEIMLEMLLCDRAYILFPCNPNAPSYSIPFIKCRPGWKVKPGYEARIDQEISDVIKAVFNAEDTLIYDPETKRQIRPYLRQALSVKSQIVMAVFPKTGDAWEIGLHQCSHDRVWTKQDSLLFKGICQRITDGLSSMLLFRELKQTKNYMDNVINSMPSILMGVDFNGMITQWNHEAEAATGTKAADAVGQYVFQFFPHLEKFVDTIKVAIKEKKVIEELKVPRSADDQTLYENITIYPIKDAEIKGAVIRMDDVSQQIQIEEMMIQSEKMLSVGGLAAGMAHEINNPLAGMMQNAQVILNRLTHTLPKNDKIAKESGTTIEAINTYMTKRQIISQLMNINEAGKRAADIVQNMLSFSRKAEGAKQYEDLLQLLEKTLELAENDYNLKKRFDFKQIKIIIEKPDKLPLVFCESSKIQQVFLNIIKNAAEEMFSSKEEMTSPPQLRFTFTAASRKVMISIRDNGPGMSEKVRKRVFEPFYTTKSPDKGTGLGLSVAFFIVVEDHLGELSVESAEGQGADFIIKLPIHD